MEKLLCDLCGNQEISIVEGAYLLMDMEILSMTHGTINMVILSDVENVLRHLIQIIFVMDFR